MPTIPKSIEQAELFDKILNEFKNKKITISANYFMLKLKITQDEFDLAISKIKKDRLISQVKQRGSSQSYGQITIEGKEFINDGGYTNLFSGHIEAIDETKEKDSEQQRRENIKFWNDIIRTWSPIIIGIGSLTIAIISLNKSNQATIKAKELIDQYEVIKYIEPDSVI